MREEYERLHGPVPNFSQQQISEETLLAEIYALIHRLPHKRTALCLSGGGIRSATFGLGVLQGLARAKLLERFDYLSTVSGGGYIGSWLSAWIKWHPRGIAGVSEELRRQPQAPLDTEPQPVTWLRRYSNFLSPRLGLLSADSWTLIGTYLRNLLLNWLVLLPLLVIGLMIPRLMVALVRWNLSDMGLPESLMKVLFYTGLGLIVVAMSYLHLYRPSLEPFRPENLKKPIEHQKWKLFESQRWFLTLSLTPTLLSVLLLTTTWAWFRNAGGTLNQLAVDGLGSRETFMVGALLIHMLSWLFSALLLRRFKHLSRWLFVEMLVIAGTGALGGFFLWSVLAKTPSEMPVSSFAEWYACFGVPGVLAMFLLTATMFVGVASRYTDDDDREWWGRSGSWILLAGAVWAAIATLVMFGPGLLAFMPAVITSLGGFSGVIALVLGFGSRTAATTGLRNRRSVKVAEYAVKLATPVFIVFLLTMLALGTSWLLKVLAHLHGVSAVDLQSIGLQMLSDPWDHANVIHNAPFWLLVEASFALAILGCGMAFVININKFSLHSMYRNRLICAYLGASRLDQYGVKRTPNLLTGFDPDDNVQMHDLAPPGQPVSKPFHVINIALNLVHGSNLAWQQRKAQSFTVSPLHCGSFASDLGYRSASRYGTNSGVGKAITIGTAMAISGAAASPNMGYHSSPTIAFLLTCFNVRLGWWLGNPGVAGARTYDRSCPEFSVGPLLAEAFGLTEANSRYVYLSDGGHFDNLGLYEMVLRRCHCILVSDAGADPDFAFQDLGNAIRKIRIDLGVDIDINLERLRRQESTGHTSGHHGVGTIHYSRVDPGAEDGILIYLKPSLTGEEPVDVLEYASNHECFPHEPTTDQFFDESQFESYRRLGEHITKEAFSAALTASRPSLSQVFETLRDRSENPRA
ncbi:MAG: patatin-like phospholipase family protein [Nitrospirae bacterium]|nr:patatin-like phospholipase family protein [Nitrospirota bacterium]